MCALDIKKILVPLDGSKNSFRGLDEAIYLARQCHATITGLYVVTLVLPSKSTPISPIEKYLLEEAKKFMLKAKTRAAQNGIVFNSKVVYCDEGPGIVNFAKNNNFNAIIIGARGRSGLKEIFLGSTSNYVMHKSLIPVIIVK
jgi:nucleotide-binding universal stress UspA family protein